MLCEVGETAMTGTSREAIPRCGDNVSKDLGTEVEAALEDTVLRDPAGRVDELLDTVAEPFKILAALGGTVKLATLGTLSGIACGDAVAADDVAGSRPSCHDGTSVGTQESIECIPGMPSTSAGRNNS